MTLSVKHQQDMGCGLLFVALGGLCLYLAQGYRFGSLAAVGPGFMPKTAAVILIGIGVILCFKALRGEIGPKIWIPVKPMLLILAACLLFALALRPLGLLVATLLAVVTARFAGPRFNPLAAIGLGFAIAAVTAGLFIWGLGLQIRVFGPLLGG